MERPHDSEQDDRRLYEQAEWAAVALPATRQQGLLMVAGALRISDQDLARAIGVSPANIFLWRTGQKNLPRRHQPALAAVLMLTWAKTRTLAAAIGTPAEAVRALDGLRDLVQAATEPVLADPTLRKKFRRIVDRMFKA